VKIGELQVQGTFQFEAVHSNTQVVFPSSVGSCK